MKSAGKNTQTMNFQRVTSVTFSLTGLFLPAEYPCSHLWLHVHEIHVLLDRSALQVPPPRCGMFVSLWVGSYQNTYRKPCFVFHFFSENWIVHMSFMCRCFLMVLCCTNLKTLWSLMVMWLCGNPHKWLLWRNRRSVTVNRSINQSTQKWSEAKYLRIFLFQWKHLKISQIDTYQIHRGWLNIPADFTWSLRPPPFRIRPNLLFKPCSLSNPQPPWATRKICINQQHKRIKNNKGTFSIVSTKPLPKIDTRRPLDLTRLWRHNTWGFIFWSCTVFSVLTAHKPRNGLIDECIIWNLPALHLMITSNISSMFKFSLYQFVVLSTYIYHDVTTHGPFITFMQQNLCSRVLFSSCMVVSKWWL